MSDRTVYSHVEHKGSEETLPSEAAPEDDHVWLPLACAWADELANSWCEHDLEE